MMFNEIAIVIAKTFSRGFLHRDRLRMAFAAYIHGGGPLGAWKIESDRYRRQQALGGQ